MQLCSSKSKYNYSIKCFSNFNFQFVSTYIICLSLKFVLISISSNLTIWILFPVICRKSCVNILQLDNLDNRFDFLHKIISSNWRYISVSNPLSSLNSARQRKRARFPLDRYFIPDTLNPFDRIKVDGDLCLASDTALHSPPSHHLQVFINIIILFVYVVF